MNMAARSASLITIHDTDMTYRPAAVNTTNPTLVVTPNHIHLVLREGGAVSPVKCQSPEAV